MKSSGLAPIWLISVAMVLGTSIVVLLPASIAGGDVIKASDWIGFSGSIASGVMTLIAAAIAWFAVQSQITVAREVAFAKEGEVWIVLREDLENVVASLDYAWRNVDRAMLKTGDKMRDDWRQRSAKQSMRVLPNDDQIKRLETFSEGLGAVKRRQLALVFYDLNQIALLGKNLQASINDPEDEDGVMFGSDLGVIQIFMSGFYRHLKRLDADLAKRLSNRHQTQVPEPNIGEWVDRLWRDSEKTEKGRFPE
jgi:hypothetical protein